MDGDYQDDPKDIKKFISKVKEGYNLVIGYQDKNYSLFVIFCGVIYKSILSIFLKSKISIQNAVVRDVSAESALEYAAAIIPIIKSIPI